MKKQWNISILVMFVLLASSLIGILTINFVQQMVANTSRINAYYKSYYLAKAGIELGLTEIKSRGIGFEIAQASGEDIIKQNFVCGDHCFFESSTQWLSNYLSPDVSQASGCQNPFMLSAGDSLMIPLFHDDFTGNVSQVFSKSVTYWNLAWALQNLTVEYSGDLPSTAVVSAGFLVLDATWNINNNGIYFKTWSLKELFPWIQTDNNSLVNRFSSYVAWSSLQSWQASDFPFKNYLVISYYTWTDSLNFCLSLSGSQLPTAQYLVTSLGTFNDQKLWLEALYKQPIPSFLLNSVGGF